MDVVLERFVAQAPIAVMVRAALSYAFADSTLDALFERVALGQYTRQLTFSTLVRLMTKVVFTSQPSVHAAYRHSDNLPVSVTAVYDKLGGLEVGVSAALVAETAEALAGVLQAVTPLVADPIAGLHLRTLDGNFLAGTEHRLDCLRHSGAAALPGMSLVVRDGRTGLLSAIIPCEDAYTNERSLSAPVLDLVRADDLWLADRNFCTEDYLGGLAKRQAFFLIRHHAGTHLHPVGPQRYVGRNASGDLYEQRVQVGGLVCRCITIRLEQPLRDGSTELRLLSNVPANRVGAKRLAEIYRRRWHIETAFQELTENLRCEINTLGFPKAALFGFALAMTAYNVVVLIRQLVAAGPGGPQASELSSYYLANEVAAVSEGLAIAVPEPIWQDFARLSAAEFAAWLQQTARGIRWQRYRKNPRGPKKTPQVQRTRRGAHRSTARVLEDHKKSP